MVERDTALDLLRTMWRIRCFEERVAKLHHSLQVHGLVHLSIGSEGVAAGVCRQLRDDDAVYSGHRAHGHALAKGAPMDRVMAELMGRSAGLCQGLGGSMHLVDVEHGLMGATGVVGGNLPMAAGDALASRLRGSDRVTVVFFGDGAVQAGHFSETVNLAALWELPLIFVCENNGMAEFTPALGPHQGGQRRRRGGAVRLRAPDRRGRRRRRGVDGVRRLPGDRRDRGTARSCWSAPPTVAAATTRAISRATATPWPTPSGRKLDPIARLEAAGHGAGLDRRGGRPAA